MSPVRRDNELCRARFHQVLRTVLSNCPNDRRRVIEFTVNTTREMFDHGEQGIALEILLSNMHEYAYPTPDDVKTELTWLAVQYRIDCRYAALISLLQP